MVESIYSWETAPPRLLCLFLVKGRNKHVSHANHEAEMVLGIRAIKAVRGPLRPTEERGFSARLGDLESSGSCTA